MSTVFGVSTTLRAPALAIRLKERDGYFLLVDPGVSDS
jgi:hypothetical protein